MIAIAGNGRRTGALNPLVGLSEMIISKRETGRPRVALVGWNVNSLSPRGQRLAHLYSALQSDFEVQRVCRRGATPPSENQANGELVVDKVRHVFGRFLVRHLLLDRTELSAVASFLCWRPEVEAAVLVGFPFAPIAYAARWLAHNEIPYVVDIGDPWVLTGEGTVDGRLKHWRAKRAERHMWEGACGAIVTTVLQREALVALFPHLKVLVRPNGYERPTNSDSDPPVSESKIQKSHNRSELRLVHYGNLYAPRLNAELFLTSLASSGCWDRIVLRQYGNDWTGLLDRVEPYIDVERHQPLAWAEVMVEAQQFDLALVIGNRNPMQLPSKAIQYLTLPLPRVALVNGDPQDALAAYVADQPAWATIEAGDEDAAPRVAKFLDNARHHGDFTPPYSESWPVVEAVLAKFIHEVTHEPEIA